MLVAFFVYPWCEVRLHECGGHSFLAKSTHTHSRRRENNHHARGIPASCGPQLLLGRCLRAGAGGACGAAGAGARLLLQRPALPRGLRAGAEHARRLIPLPAMAARPGGGQRWRALPAVRARAIGRVGPAAAAALPSGRLRRRRLALLLAAVRDDRAVGPHAVCIPLPRGGGRRPLLGRHGRDEPGDGGRGAARTPRRPHPGASPSAPARPLSRALPRARLPAVSSAQPGRPLVQPPALPRRRTPLSAGAARGSAPCSPPCSRRTARRT